MTNEEEAQDALGRLNETRDHLMREIRKGIIGQNEVIEQLLITLLARGHCLLTGIPGQLFNNFILANYSFANFPH